MKVLVTGSTGFIGAALCRALVNRGNEVRAFHRVSSSLRMLKDLPVEHVIGDLTQPESIASAMQDVEVVFHAGALLGARQGRMYTVTVEGTRAVMQAALHAGVRRVVHTSSVAALGLPVDTPAGGRPEILNENHTWNSAPDAYPYGYAKYLAELEVQRAVAQGLDAVIVNPAVVFGAGDVYRLNSSIVVQFVQGKVPFSVEGGLNAVHIDDVVAGHLAALEQGRRGERYILAGENMTHTELLRKIAVAAGLPPLRVELPAGLVRAAAGPLSLFSAVIRLPVNMDEIHLAGKYFYYDTRKAQTDLRLPAPKPANEALAEALTWFQANGAVK